MKKIFVAFLLLGIIEIVLAEKPRINDFMHFNWGMTIEEIKTANNTGPRGLNVLIRNWGPGSKTFQYSIPYTDPAITLLGKHASLFFSVSTDLQLLTKAAFAINVPKSFTTKYSNAASQKLTKMYGKATYQKSRAFWQVSNRTYVTIDTIGGFLGVIYFTAIKLKALKKEAKKRMSQRIEQHFKNQ